MMYQENHAIDSRKISAVQQTTTNPAPTLKPLRTQELVRMLQRSEKQIDEGKYKTADEVFSSLRYTEMLKKPQNT